MGKGRLRPHLYALAFIDEFGPVYAVWTLIFNDNGVSTSQISIAFIVWGVAALVLEIPSGAVADRVDRRHLLATAFVLRGSALVLWLLAPNFTTLIVGAVVFAIHDASASGSWEALIHDELEAIGDERHYGKVMARISQFSNLGVAAGTLLGAALLNETIGIEVELTTLGWITVAAHVGSIALVVRLPDVRWVAQSGEPWSYQAWLATLRGGLAEARRVPVIGKLIVLGALIEGTFLFDEYVPLLTRARGGADSAAPVIFLVIWVALLIGDEIVARRPDVRGVTIGVAMLFGVGASATALLADPVWTLALIGVGYAVHEIAWIPTDARLQERASGEYRATVTSVRGFSSALVATTFFLVIALVADGDDPTPGLLAMLGVVVVIAVLLMVWLPPHRHADTTDGTRDGASGTDSAGIADSAG